MDIEKITREVMRELSMCGALQGASAGGGMPFDCTEVPRHLEHSLLVADMPLEKLLEGCKLSRSLDIAALCVAPYYVMDAAEALAGSNVKVCAAIGFPSAFMSTGAKVADVRESTAQGAEELDIAIDMAAVKSGDWQKAEKDFFAACDAANGRAAVKAVFEHGAYNEAEKQRVLEMIGRSGAQYVKVQNMVSGHGARAEEISLVRSVLGSRVQIKIDGGVKTLEQALELFRAGADRIGLTATKAVAEAALACKTC